MSTTPQLDAQIEAAKGCLTLRELEDTLGLLAAQDALWAYVITGLPHAAFTQDRWEWNRILAHPVATAWLLASHARYIAKLLENAK